MSDTNRMRLSYRVEADYGVESTGGDYQTLRITGESLKQDTDSRTSDEIRNDRQVADVYRTQVGASGQINMELSGGTLDDFLAAALGASLTWPAAVNPTNVAVSVTLAPDTYTADATDFVDDLVVGQWVFITGFAEAGNNGFKKVLTVTGSPMTAFTVASPLAMVVESAVGSTTYQMGGQIINGTTLSSFTFQKEFLDLSSDGSLHLGMVVESADLRISTGEPITGNFSFLGAEEQNKTSGFNTTILANTNPVIQSVDHVLHTLEGGHVVANVIPITELEISIRNNNRNRMQVGSVAPVSQGLGSFEVTGNVRQFYATNALFTKYLSYTVSNLTVIINETGTPYRYVIELPQVRYGDAQRVSAGKDQDILADMSFTAYMDPTELITMRIARFLV